MSEAKIFTVFLVYLLQLPGIKTTSHNVIHLYVFMLGSRSYFMHVSDMNMICMAWLQGVLKLKLQRTLQCTFHNHGWSRTAFLLLCRATQVT